jgi:hypothetical protein
MGPPPRSRRDDQIDDSVILRRNPVAQVDDTAGEIPLETRERS